MPGDIDIWMTRARDHDDRAAFTRVVEASHHLLRATILRDTANIELADEIAQESLVRAWTKRHQYRPGTSPRAWLLAIARSQVMEHHRRQNRDRRHLKDLIHRELLRHRDTGGDDTKQERLAALQHCVAEISDDNRELLSLVHGRGLSTEEAADELGIKPPACRQRLSRLQRALRRCAEGRLRDQGLGT
ncbi:MAG: RNA polymerase sigma factor [Planctomycetota bacterium]